MHEPNSTPPPSPTAESQAGETTAPETKKEKRASAASAALTRVCLRLPAPNDRPADFQDDIEIISDYLISRMQSERMLRGRIAELEEKVRELDQIASDYYALSARGGE